MASLAVTKTNIRHECLHDKYLLFVLTVENNIGNNDWRGMSNSHLSFLEDWCWCQLTLSVKSNPHFKLSVELFRLDFGQMNTSPQKVSLNQIVQT